MKWKKIHLTNVRIEIWNFPAISMTLQVKSQLNITENNKSSEKEVMTSNRKENTDPMKKYLGSLKTIKPPIFNGEVEKGEEANPWLSGMKKYIHIYNYSNESKAKMAIYNMFGKVDIWWQDIKNVKGIKERCNLENN